MTRVIRWDSGPPSHHCFPAPPWSTDPLRNWVVGRSARGEGHFVKNICACCSLLFPSPNSETLVLCYKWLWIIHKFGSWSLQRVPAEAWQTWGGKEGFSGPTEDIFIYTVASKQGSPCGFKQMNREVISEKKTWASFFPLESINAQLPSLHIHVPVPDTLGLENVAALEATLFWIPRGVQWPKAVGGDRVEEILALLSFSGNQILRISSVNVLFCYILNPSWDRETVESPASLAETK